MNKRGLPLEIEQYTSIDMRHYSLLFEEYFAGRLSWNTVHNFGGYGPSNKYTKHSFITVHVTPDLNSCVGFICMREHLNASRNIQVQGIVACPFYRHKSIREEGKLGVANTIITYLDDYRCDTNIIVNPIRNTNWKTRLSEISFFVDNSGKRIVSEERVSKKNKVS